jgi:DNA-binding NtrC family response regulator
VGGEKSAPVVLVVARAPRLRRGVTAALTPEFAVHELQPEKALDPARWLDAACMVVALDAEDDETTLEALESLSALPAAGALVLLLEAAPESLIDSALEQLAPHQVLSAPVAAPVLRYAVGRALPSHTPGRGARPNHRPAPALLGVSSAIREVIDQIRQIAPTHLPALILGETGTGKELVARAIHEQSPRCGSLFVAINCGALPDSLLESELFGHRRGSFTGADRDKRGLFEHADGGTILLDEIGDTSPALQMKLLRALENKEIRPLGDTRTIRVDVRVVSATHRNLEAAIGISTTGSTRSPSTCLRCAVGASTSRSWPSTSPRSSARRTRGASRSRRTSSSRWPSATSRATCASCATPWSAPSPWRRPASP